MQKPRDWLYRNPWIRSVGLYAAMHQIIVLISASVILLLSSYGVAAAFTGHINIVGETLVDVEIPSPQISPLTAKPVSILMVAALGLAFSGYELAKPKFLKLSGTQMSLLKMIAFVAIALSAYEVLYNFAIWTASIASNSLLGVLNPDILINQFPNPKTPWNLVFATKLTTTTLAISVYTFYVLRQAEKQIDGITT
ncbi:MAG: hypothetical protein ACYC7D_07810 [Nitrososphaerales archaeon]